MAVKMKAFKWRFKLLMSLDEDSEVKKSKNRGLKAVPKASSHEATGGTFLDW